MLSIEAEPAIVGLGGEVTYTITTRPEGFESMVSYTPADTGAAGVQTVTATCGSSSAETQVTVVEVDFDDSEIEIFRSEEKFAIVTVEPESAYSLVNILVTGDDDIHFSANYDETTHYVDIWNLIEESEELAWMDQKVINVIASLGGEEVGNWDKVLKFKKNLLGIWDNIKSKGESELNNLISPADEAGEWLEDKLYDISSIDNDGVIHTISPARITSARMILESAITTKWTDFLQSIFPAIPVSEYQDDYVNESWTLDWNWNTEVQMSGGTFSLNPEFSHVWQWIDSLNNYGWSSSLFDWEAVTVAAGITANGSTAIADVLGSVNASATYTHPGGECSFALCLQIHGTF